MFTRWKTWFKIALALAAVAAIVAGRLRDPHVWSWWQPAPSDASDRFVAELMRPATIKLVGVPAREAYRRMESEFGIRVYGLDDNIDPDDDWREYPVTVAVTNVSRLGALQLIEEQLPIRRHLIVIDGRLELVADDDAETDAYSVGRFYPFTGHLADGRALSPDEFESVVLAYTGWLTWDAWGGKAGFLEPAEHGVAIIHWPQVHHQVAELLAAIEACESPEADPRPILLGDAVYHGSDSLRAKLAQATHAETWPQLLLHEWLDRISDQYDVPIILDRDAFERESLKFRERYNFSFTGRSLDRDLRETLEPFLLRYMPYGDALLVTTQNGMEHRTYARIYPVRDLLTRLDLGSEWLGDLLFEMVSPRTWDELGGPGSCIPLNHALVVRQNRDVHLQVEQFLNGLRRHLLAARPAASDADFEPHSLDPPQASPWRHPVTISARHRPLRRVLQEMMSQAGGELRFYRIRETEIEPWASMPVNLDVEGVPLYVALGILFGTHPSELDYSLEAGGTLWVYGLNNGAANNNFPRMSLRTYDLARLAAEFSADDAPYILSPIDNALEEVICSLVAESSWDEMGGPGALAGANHVLLVSQTEDVHEELSEFLETLAAAVTGPFHADPIFTGPRAAEKLQWWHALRQPASIRFEDVTLNEAMEQIRRDSGVPVRWADPKTGNGRRFSLDLTGCELSWYSVLQHLARSAVASSDMHGELSEYNLQAFPMHITEGGVVLAPAYATQDSDVRGGSVVRVYRVDDFLATRTVAYFGIYTSHGSTAYAYEEVDTLILLLKTLTDAKEWAGGGGVNYMYQLDGRAASVLCVRAPERMQHAVWQALAALRNLRDRPAVHPFEVRLLDARDDRHAPASLPPDGEASAPDANSFAEEEQTFQPTILNHRQPLFAVSAEVLLQRLIGGSESGEDEAEAQRREKPDTWFSPPAAPRRNAAGLLSRAQAAKLAADFLADYCADFEIEEGFHGNYDEESELSFKAWERTRVPWVLAEGEPQVHAALQVQLRMQSQGDRWPTLAQLNAAEGPERMALLEKMLDELRRAGASDDEQFTRWRGLRLLHLWITHDFRPSPDNRTVEGLLLTQEERLLLSAAAEEWVEKPSPFPQCRRLENLLDELLNSDMP